MLSTRLSKTVPATPKSILQLFRNTAKATGNWLNLNKDIIIQDEKYPVDYMTNVTPEVLGQMERKLHLDKNNPIYAVKQKVYDYFRRYHVNENGDPIFTIFDDLSPVTTPYQNFDSLLIPVGHKDRSEMENYFLNEGSMLRCHMTPHVPDLISMGYNNFLLSGDVYRRDTYDHLHCHIFHQLEVQRLFTTEELFGNCLNTADIFNMRARTSKRETEAKQCVHTSEAVQVMSSDMKRTLEEIVFGELLGHGVSYRWSSNYEQFGRPAYEMEILHDNKWLEIAAVSILKQEILDTAGACNKVGWGLTFGLDRIAMALYGIPDIRLLRSDQYGSHAGQDNLFKSYSDCPTFFKEIVSIVPHGIDDVAFAFAFYELVRIAAEDVVQKVELADQFNRSHRYRITYKSWNKSLNKEEVNAHHSIIKQLVTDKLNAKVVF
jgi:phenylalanyl-tRNA synthetase alpha chain